MLNRARNEAKARIESMPARRKRPKNGLLWRTAGVALLPLAGLAQQVKPLLPLPLPPVVTVAGIGNENAYGVVFVQPCTGAKGLLRSGEMLASTSNDNANLQGTGTTVIRIGEDGQPLLFFQGQPAVGLTAALDVVRNRFVIVGNLLIIGGASGTEQPGALLVLNIRRKQAGQLADSDLLNGPRGRAIHNARDTAQVFIPNVLTGSIVRLEPIISADADAAVLKQALLVGFEFNHRPYAAVLLLAPSDPCYHFRNDLLYVVSPVDGAIDGIADAGATLGGGDAGTLVKQDNLHFDGPLDLVMPPNSGAFGLTQINAGAGNRKFAPVNDNQNTLSAGTVAIK